MTTIRVQKRDMNVKAKKLRREGFVPGIICGKDIKELLAIQIADKDAQKLIRENEKGSRVELLLDEEKIYAIIKEYSINSISNKIESLDFQALVKGERINTSVKIILKNESQASGVVTQEISEVHYKADSDHLLDTIILDFEKLKGVKTMKVSDLDEFKNSDISVSNPDSVIFSVTQAVNEETDDTTEENKDEVVAENK